jgi:predicted Zn finger-like uncharacterized protein
MGFCLLQTGQTRANKPAVFQRSSTCHAPKGAAARCCSVVPLAGPAGAALRRRSVSFRDFAMPVNITCPNCKARIKAPDSALGKTLKCPKCGKPIAVAAPDPPVASVYTPPTVRQRKAEPFTFEDEDDGDARPVRRKSSRPIFTFASCIGLAVLLSCAGCFGIGMVGMYFGSQAVAEARKALAQADQDWDAGKKADAVSVYKSHYTLADDKGKLVKRIADFEAETGNTAEARQWVEKGLDEKLNVVYDAPAQAIYAQIKKEHDDKAAQEKERKAKEEADAKPINYTVLKKERRPADGRDFLAILVDEKASKDNVLKLANGLWRAGNVATLDVFDDRAAYKASEFQAHNGREDPTYPEAKLSKHWLAQAFYGVDDDVKWIADGRDH